MLEEIAQYKVIIDALGALLAPVIAATVAFIAYQQWRVNRRREVRESKQGKLSVYLRVKRLLQDVDETRTIDKRLLQQFREAEAEADFLFPAPVREWLEGVSLAASCALDIQERTEAWRGEGGDPDEPWVKRETLGLEREIDTLQDAHCQVLQVFRPYIRGVGH